MTGIAVAVRSCAQSRGNWERLEKIGAGSGQIERHDSASVWVTLTEAACCFVAVANALDVAARIPVAAALPYPC